MRWTGRARRTRRCGGREGCCIWRFWHVWCFWVGACIPALFLGHDGGLAESSTSRARCLRMFIPMLTTSIHMIVIMMIISLVAIVVVVIIIIIIITNININRFIMMIVLVLLLPLLLIVLWR